MGFEMTNATCNYQVGIDTNIEGSFDIRIHTHALLVPSWYEILTQNMKLT